MTADVLQFIPRSLLDDGGKARIQKRREFLMLDRKYGMSPVGGATDLTMDHADSGVPCDVGYHAPDRDPA